jgi:hypothetical protein
VINLRMTLEKILYVWHNFLLPFCNL